VTENSQGLLPPSTNGLYRGARASAWFLAVGALFTLGPGLIHSFLPDGGAGVIAGLDMGDRRELVIGVFRWEGATQLAFGLAMLAVAIRYRPLTPLFLALVLLQAALVALQGWVLSPPANGHHPPAHYGAVAAALLSAAFLALSLRVVRRGEGRSGGA
jgi:hypothetical protein